MNENTENFCFTEDNLRKAQEIISHYPINRERSAVLALLELAQSQIGYLPQAAMEYVATMLNMPFIRVLEVATFYSMFHLVPVGEHHIQICTTTPCWLRGADKILRACEEELDIKCGEVSYDKKFSLCEVQCLGACVNAPVVQINNKHYFEDLTPQLMKNIINKLKNNQPLKNGSQIGRNGSAPQPQ